jgi:hypothetical protein
MGVAATHCLHLPAWESPAPGPAGWFVRRTGSDLVTWSIDARHNAPRGASAIGIDYGIDGLPLHVDWYVYPRSQVVWVADARVMFDEQDLRRLDDTFREHLDKREVQPPAPKAVDCV